VRVNDNGAPGGWVGRVARGTLLAAGAAFGYAAVQANRRIMAMEQLTAEAAAPGGTFAMLGGARVHYVEDGPADGPAVVLLHGLAASSATWNPVVAALRGTYHVIAPDLLGFGYSQRSSVPIYTLRHRAQNLAALLDYLGIARATVVGHSLGGAVALQFACNYPARVARLVLVDAVAGYDGKGRAPSPVAGEVLRRTPLGKIVLAQTFYDDARALRILRSAYYDPARLTPEVLETYYGPRRVRGTAESFLALTATRPDDDLPGCVPGIAAPTLIVWGREDRWVKPGDAGRLHAELPGSRLAWIEECGHVPQEEHPARFIQVLRDFLEEAQ
jgi:pimeloyl-ACP methyl ester carboxylesterase